MPGTPLLPLVPQHVQHRPGAAGAYDMLLRLETTILAENDHTTSRVVTGDKGKRDVDLTYCRIVGNLFHCVPSDFGLANLVKEVGSTGGDRLDLGKLYDDLSFRVREFILTVFCPFSLIIR